MRMTGLVGLMDFICGCSTSFRPEQLTLPDGSVGDVRVLSAEAVDTGTKAACRDTKIRSTVGIICGSLAYWDAEMKRMSRYPRSKSTVRSYDSQATPSTQPGHH